MSGLLGQPERKEDENVPDTARQWETVPKKE